jgi:hypothetical protein
VVRLLVPDGAVAVITGGRSAEAPLSLLGWMISQMATEAPMIRARSEPRYRLTDGTPLDGSRQTLQKSSPCSSQYGRPQRGHCCVGSRSQA